MTTPDGLWRWLNRLRGLLRRNDVEREIREEMEYHLEMEVRRRVDEEGQSAAEARRTARRAFGSVESHRAASRDVRYGHHLEQLAADLRLALRRLAGAPGFSLVVVLTVAVGIGAATAISSLSQRTLFPELPYDDVERVLRIRTGWTDKADGGVSPAELLDYQSRLGHVVSHAGGYTIRTSNLAGESGPRKVATAAVSHGVLEALGIEAARGRVFTVAEDRAGADVVLISHALWITELAADPGVVGSSIVLDGEPAEILGVLPDGPVLPESIRSREPVDLYVPLALKPEDVTNRGSHFMSAVVRTKPGVDPRRAAAEVAALGDRFVREYPDEYPDGMGFFVRAEPLMDWLRQPYRQPMAVLLGAVGFLLLVALANVAGLLLARTEERGRELAMRAALGAGLRRLAQQLAVENALLAVAGASLGLFLGRGLLIALSRWVPPSQAAFVDPSIGPAVLGVTTVLAAVASLAFGMLPLLHLRGQKPVAALRGTRTSTADASGRRLRKALMVVQVAVSLLLLTTAGLLGRSFVRLLDVDPGYRTEGLVTVQASLPSAGYESDQATLDFWRRLVADVEARPGVRGATAALFLVLTGPIGDLGFDIEGRETPEGKDKPDADWQVVAPGYFELLDVETLAGRTLTTRDAGGSPGAVVVNRAFVERNFPDAASPTDVLGQRLFLGGEHTQPDPATIVGVIPDVRHGSLDERRRPQMYFSHGQFRIWSTGQPIRSMNLIVDSALPLDATRELMAESVLALDPTLPLSQMRSLEEVRHASLTLPRLLAAVLLTFAVATLFLTVVGLYGVVSETVLRRLPELGVRRALGARAADLTRLVVGEGLRLFAAGLAIGAILTLLAGTALRDLLFETSPFEPATYLAMIALLLASVLAACAVPALRAARVDPSKLMRLE